MPADLNCGDYCRLTGCEGNKNILLYAIINGFSKRK